MPSLDTKKKIYSIQSQGMARKRQSDIIMEETWDRDTSSQIAYIYDYYHDDEPLKYIDLHPEKSKTKFPIDIKFFANAYNSENKDQVGYHIQFKPSFNWKDIKKLSYYETDFVQKYDALFPIGMYVDIMDSKGVYRKWLITENANWLGNQFPTWYILPIDYIFQWIHEGIKYQMCGVSRSQSSYNSGEWRDYIFSTTQNQRKCILPMNEISSTIYYNKRLAISVPMKTPIIWHCSKVEPTSPKGVNRLTFTQQEWDEHKDVFEYENGEITNVYYPDKKVVSMWCDYNESNVKPIDQLKEELETSVIHSVITYTGIKPVLKIGGSYKKFTVDFYNGENEKLELLPGTWSYEIDGADASSLLSILTNSDSTDVEENQIKLKFDGDISYIGKVLTISYTTTDGINSSLEIELLRL